MARIGVARIGIARIGVHVVSDRGDVRQAIFGVGNGCPLTRIQRHFDFVFGRQPVLELLVSVTTPDDAIDFERLSKLDAYPAAPALATDPTASIPSPPIVDIAQPVLTTAVANFFIFMQVG